MLLGSFTLETLPGWEGTRTMRGGSSVSSGRVDNTYSKPGVTERIFRSEPEALRFRAALLQSAEASLPAEGIPLQRLQRPPSDVAAIDAATDAAMDVAELLRRRSKSADNYMPCAFLGEHLEEQRLRCAGALTNNAEGSPFTFQASETGDYFLHAKELITPVRRAQAPSAE